MLLEPRDRHVVPRWRDFKTTLSLGELQNSKDPDPIGPEDKEAISRRVAEFNVNRDVWHAADLLSSAFVVGDSDSAALARKFILANRTRAPKALLSFASGAAGEDVGRDSPYPDTESHQKLIHHTRRRLRSEPRNAIQWVELSRFYTLVGDSSRALRSMTTAASLAPDNRFVVRSAARLFLHEHDASTALKIIRRAAGAKRDPWLLAAEIAVATASHSATLFAKIGTNRNADDNISLFSRTELSSALATLEMNNGRTKKARQLFRQSLKGPNENSVAQVEWANRQIGGLEIDKGLLTVPRSFEASANLNLVAGDWDYALAEGMEWLRDQSFSSTPAAFTSYVSSLIEDYERSIGILRTSLKLNPNDPILINNLGFALASANRLEEAAALLKGIDLETATKLSAITLAATFGLLFFRKGLPDHGRELYQLAISRAGSQGNSKYRAMAILYLAREELIAATPAAEMATNRALVEASKIDDKEVALIASQIRKLEAALKEKAPPNSESRAGNLEKGGCSGG